MTLKLRTIGWSLALLALVMPATAWVDSPAEVRANSVASSGATRLTSNSPQAIQAPLLKWQRVGCYSSWCETGWYSSPAVADLDGDGAPEVIGSAYSIVVLDGATGALVWGATS